MTIGEFRDAACELHSAKSQVLRLRKLLEQTRAELAEAEAKLPEAEDRYIAAKVAFSATTSVRKLAEVQDWDDVLAGIICR